MDGTMSQEEINALLNNPSGTDENPENTLTEQEKMRSVRSRISVWEQRQLHCFHW